MERISRQPDCEVILATGSDVEGEATATYLHHLLKEMDCRISRPAQGLPAGSGLSHADTLTLMLLFGSFLLQLLTYVKKESPSRIHPGTGKFPPMPPFFTVRNPVMGTVPFYSGFPASRDASFPQ